MRMRIADRRVDTGVPKRGLDQMNRRKSKTVGKHSHATTNADHRQYYLPCVRRAIR